MIWYVVPPASFSLLFLCFWASMHPHINSLDPPLPHLLTSTLFLSFSRPSLVTLWCLLIMSLGCLALKGYAIDLSDHKVTKDYWTKLKLPQADEINCVPLIFFPTVNLLKNIVLNLSARLDFVPVLWVLTIHLKGCQGFYIFDSLGLSTVNLEWRIWDLRMKT